MGDQIPPFRITTHEINGAFFSRMTRPDHPRHFGLKDSPTRIFEVFLGPFASHEEADGAAQASIARGDWVL